MAPKATKPGKTKIYDKQKAQAEKKSEAARQETEMKEAAARQLAQSIEKGPGPPPFWILDSAAKLRDPQCKLALRLGSAKKFLECTDNVAHYVSFFAGALSCAITGDADEEVRYVAVKALGSLGEIGLPYIDALTHAILKDSAASVRGAAAKALARCCGSPQKTAAKTMCVSLFAMPVQHDDIKELDEEMVTEIAAGFATLTRKQLPLMKNLMNQQHTDIDKALRLEAAEKLCKAALPEAEEKSRILNAKAALADARRPSADGKPSSAGSAKPGSAGSAKPGSAGSGKPASAEGVKRPRGLAAKALAALPEEKPPPDTYASAVQAFSAYMVEGLPALQKYCNAFLHKSDIVRTRKALDSLLPVAMNDTDDDVRQKATEALSELNFSTAPMLAGLAETLQGDPAAIKRMRAAQTFSSFINISDQMAAETLQLQGPALAAAAMRDKVPGVRQAAAVALGTSLTQAGPYIGELVGTLRSGDNLDDRKGAARALGALGPAAEPHIVDLFEAVYQDSDFSVRYWSAESLGLLGEPAVVYVKAFAVIALYDKNTKYKVLSNDALQSVGAVAGDIVDQFTIDDDDQEQARQEASAKVLEAVEVPFHGLIVEEVEQSRSKRRSRSQTQRLAAQAEEDSLHSVPKTPVLNRDFHCNVGKFLRDVAEKRAEEERQKEQARLEAESPPEPEAIESPSSAASPNGKGRKKSKEKSKDGTRPSSKDGKRPSSKEGKRPSSKDGARPTSSGSPKS